MIDTWTCALRFTFAWHGGFLGFLGFMSMGGELLFLCGLLDGVYGLFKMMLIKIWLDTG